MNGLRLESYLYDDLFPQAEGWPAMERYFIMDNAPFYQKPEVNAFPHSQLKH